MEEKHDYRTYKDNGAATAQQRSPRRWCLLLIAAAMALPQLLQAQDTIRMTLAQCLEYAYGHNSSICSAALDKENAVAALAGARLRFTPTIIASAGESWNFQDGTSTRDGSYGLNGSLTLFSGLSNLRNYRQSRVNVASSEAKIQQTANNISSQIIESYLTILMNREKLSYQYEVLHRSREQMEEGLLKHSVGKMLESDYLLLEANYENASTTLENTKLTIASNLLALRTLMGCDSVVDAVDALLLLPDTTLPALAQVMTQARATLPDYTINDLAVERARYDVKLAQSSYLPTLSLSAGTTHYGGRIGQVNGSGTVVSSEGTSSNVGLSLNIPIFNQGTHRTQLKQSKINLQQAELSRQQAIRDLDRQIEGQFLTTQQALNLYNSAAKLQKAYKANYDVYAAKYAEGMVTTVTMLQQQDQYLSATNDYLQNKYSYLLDRMILNIYMGAE